MKRNCRFEVRLTKDEYYELTKKSRKAGLSAGAYVRHAIAGTEVREAPPADIPMLLREMRRIGYNVNQTLKRANSTGIVDMPQFRKDMSELRKATELITAAYSRDE